MLAIFTDVSLVKLIRHHATHLTLPSLSHRDFANAERAKRSVFEAQQSCISAKRGTPFSATNDLVSCIRLNNMLS